MQESVQGIAETFASRRSEDEDKTDSLRVINADRDGLKDSWPKIDDTDPDLDRYDMEFDTAVKCANAGRKNLSDVDIY